MAEPWRHSPDVRWHGQEMEEACMYLEWPDRLVIDVLCVHKLDALKKFLPP